VSQMAVWKRTITPGGAIPVHGPKKRIDPTPDIDDMNALFAKCGQDLVRRVCALRKDEFPNLCSVWDMSFGVAGSRVRGGLRSTGRRKVGLRDPAIGGDGSSHLDPSSRICSCCRLVGASGSLKTPQIRW
jgi:hypothetical protein